MNAKMNYSSKDDWGSLQITVNHVIGIFIIPVSVKKLLVTLCHQPKGNLDIYHLVLPHWGLCKVLSKSQWTEGCCTYSGQTPDNSFSVT